MQNVQNIKDYRKRIKVLMERKFGVTEARSKFREIVEQVQYQGDTYIINKHGKPAAAMVPIEVYEAWKRQRAGLFDLIRGMQTEADLSPEEAARLVAEAVAAVRIAA
jgi:prevent-host-death family protein